MGKSIKAVLCVVGMAITILALFGAGIFVVVTRFSNPDYTETRLFLEVIKPVSILALIGVSGYPLADHCKDLLD